MTTCSIDPTTFMIAYVRDGATIASGLEPYLAKPLHAARYVVQADLAALPAAGLDPARSRHGRSFHYTQTTTPVNDPGAISLWHLWVDASPVEAT